MGKYKYSEVYSHLNFETAILIFMKKNGEIRVMLGTRNLNTVAFEWGFQGRALGGHDTRCNINNGNVAVFDLLLGDARSFNIDRLISVEYMGVVNSMEELNKAAEVYKQFVAKYEEGLKDEGIDNMMNVGN